MSAATVELTDGEFKTLEKKWPRGPHASIGARAMEITCIYLRRQHPNSVFEAPVAGPTSTFDPQFRVDQYKVSPDEWVRFRRA
jgi:hypothetical protein